MAYRTQGLFRVQSQNGFCADKSHCRWLSCRTSSSRLSQLNSACINIFGSAVQPSKPRTANTPKRLKRPNGSLTVLATIGLPPRIHPRLLCPPALPSQSPHRNHRADRTLRSASRTSWNPTSAPSSSTRNSIIRKLNASSTTISAGSSKTYPSTTLSPITTLS